MKNPKIVPSIMIGLSILVIAQGWFLIGNFRVISWAVTNKAAVSKVQSMQVQATNAVVDNIGAPSK